MQEASGPWLDHCSPNARSSALWTMFASFGLPHRFPNYHHWIEGLPEGSMSDPNFPATLDWEGLDRFIYWLSRGEVWATAFIASRIADGTMLCAVLRLEHLVSISQRLRQAIDM